MEEYKLGLVESRFADIIWEHAPISSGELVKLCLAELEWKKSTTYTVLKKLCDRGLFQNEGGTVTSKMSREEYDARHSALYVEENFGGSLPAFLAAFGSRKKLSQEEIRQLEALIERMR